MHDRQVEHRRNRRTARRKRVSPLRRPVIRLLLFSLLLGAALGMAYLFLGPITKAKVAHVPLTDGLVEIAVDVDAVLVRNERVYTAPVSGTVHRLVPEGQRVRVGDTVVEVGSGGGTPPDQSAGGPPDSATPDSSLLDEIEAISERIFTLAGAQAAARDRGDQNEAERIQAEMDKLAQHQADLAREAGRRRQVVTEPLPAPSSGASPVATETAGVLVYQVDGLEEALSTGADGWTHAWFKSLDPDPRKTGEGLVALGAPLFKVVDNLSPGILAVMPQEQFPAWAAEARIQVRFPGRDWRPVRASVIGHQTEAGEVLLRLQVPVLPDELTWIRRIRATLVFDSFEGMVAPRSAVDVKDGHQGVWVQDGHDTRFWPVRVLGGNATEVALETDLPVGTPILRVPPPQMR